MANVPYYDGCLIVQVHNHGPTASPTSSADLPSTPRQGNRANFGHPTAVNHRNSNPALGPNLNVTNLNGLSQSLDAPARNGGANAKPSEPYRLVLAPTVEALWSDLALIFKDQISERDGLEMEAKILELTTQALCLDPNFEATRMANHLLNETMVTHADDLPGTASSRKRKRFGAPEGRKDKEEERVKAERVRNMRLMDESYGRPFAPTYSPLLPR